MHLVLYNPAPRCSCNQGHLEIVIVIFYHMHAIYGIVNELNSAIYTLAFW